MKQHFHIQAHRGARAECPENTMAAFERALEIGADSVELDVHMTKDGQIAVFHDFYMNAVAVHSMTLSELQKKDPRIPALKDVFERFRNENFIVDVEIKSDERYPD